MVLRCVVVSTRLCTCNKSIVLVCSNPNERSIELMPASLPRVQTFVARKRESRSPNLPTRSPITCSARPYMGEESITRPVHFTKSRIKGSSIEARAGLTSKTRHVPKPITGSFSPEPGIARVITPDDSLAPRLLIGKSIPPLLCRSRTLPRAASSFGLSSRETCQLRLQKRNRGVPVSRHGSCLKLVQPTLFPGKMRATSKWHLHC